MSAIDHDVTRLIDLMRGLDSVVVAFSGGVDSSVVAAAAVQACGSAAIAVTADSPSVARWQLKTARRVAREIGIEHVVTPTGEIERVDYRRNDQSRCFYCKETLYAALACIAEGYRSATILSGTNADDLQDHRPGIKAGRIAGVRTPLAELGIGKERVRKLAQRFGLSNHDLPASPCLASRVALGIEVTAERLGRVEQAEELLRSRGFDQVRVRLHADQLARIEVPPDQLARLIELDQSVGLTSQLRDLGFRYVTVDLQGFESGSMHRSIVSLETLS